MQFLQKGVSTMDVYYNLPKKPTSFQLICCFSIKNLRTFLCFYFFKYLYSCGYLLLSNESFFNDYLRDISHIWESPANEVIYSFCHFSIFIFLSICDAFFFSSRTKYQECFCFLSFFFFFFTSACAPTICTLVRMRLHLLRLQHSYLHHCFF